MLKQNDYVIKTFCDLIYFNNGHKCSNFDMASTKLDALENLSYPSNFKFLQWLLGTRR